MQCQQTQAVKGTSALRVSVAHRTVKVQALFGRKATAVVEKPTKKASKTTSSKTTKQP